MLVGATTINVSDWEATVETVEVDTTTGFDAGDETCIPGTRKVTGTFNGPWNAAAGNGQNAPFVRNAIVTLTLNPGDGGPLMSFPALLTRVGVPVQVKGGVMFRITYRSSGPISGI